MFAKFGRVFVLGVAEWCGVISVSCFEVGFCKSDVCFRGVVVVPCDGGLINVIYDIWYIYMIYDIWYMIYDICYIYIYIYILGKKQRDYDTYISLRTVLWDFRD